MRQRQEPMRPQREQKQQVRQLERGQVREQPLGRALELELLLSYRKQTRQRQR